MKRALLVLLILTQAGCVKSPVVGSMDKINQQIEVMNCQTAVQADVMRILLEQRTELLALHDARVDAVLNKTAHRLEPQRDALDACEIRRPLQP
jgi:hypothetical protein